MSLKETFTTLMDSARKHFEVEQKLSIADLNNLFNPNPNLLTGTKDFDGFEETQLWSKADFSHIENNSQNTVEISTKHEWNGLTKKANLNPGTYTFSVSYYVDSDYPSNGALNIFILNGDGNFYDIVDHPMLDNLLVPVKNKWQRASITFTVKQASDKFAFRLESTVPGILQVSSYKLERGMLATPWCPASSELVGS